ncbi:MAG TPA: PAS domain-containing sensor histidine kinase [Ignavibacteriales bacterium]|nr:PAS domain-containing sensor histidine kinase [Ignavibacteriales bacterium]
MHAGSSSEELHQKISELQERLSRLEDLERENLLLKEKLLESEEKYRNIADMESDAILLVDNSSGQLLDVNSAACSLYGYGKEEMLLLNIMDLSAEPEKTRCVMLEHQTLVPRRIHKKKDGSTFPIEINIKFYELNGREMHVSAVRDISEWVKAESLLIESKERAEKSDRLKGEFLAQMSHEIRSPLNSILNFASLIKESCRNIMNEDLQMSFSIIDQASKRLIRTIDLIINMSELQTDTYDFTPVKVDVNSDILQKLFLEYTPQAKNSDLEFELYSHTQDTIITGDAYSLYQIFNNLIDNAIKYTKKGRVEIIISRNKGLEVEVRDTGIGISQEFMFHIFHPFSQEEQGYTRRFEGNGLGLALVKKYAEMNGARIDVKSLKGEGSSFKVIF